jgi:hypothetical protein
MPVSRFGGGQDSKAKELMMTLNAKLNARIEEEVGEDNGKFLALRVRLDLADTLARQRELLANFLQRVVSVHADPACPPTP